MLFIYSNASKTLKKSIIFNGSTLQLHLVDENETSYIYDIATTSDDDIKEKLSRRFSEPVEVNDCTSHQFIKLNDGFVGYTYGEDDVLDLIKTFKLDHKPTEEERAKIVPNNAIICITDTDTTVWTHPNNIHQSTKMVQKEIGTLKFTTIVPKWNNWKSLKFPAGILVENDKKHVKDKVILSYNVRKRKDTSKYYMNSIKVVEWGEKDRIFTPNKGDNRKRNNNGKQQKSPRYRK